MWEKFDKDYLKKAGLTVFGILCCVAVAFYIGYHIWHKFTSFVEFEPAVPYTVTVTAEGEGYVFREETVLYSNEAGSLVPTLSDGERVGTYAEVGRIFSDADPEASLRIDEINSQIEVLSSVVYADNLTTKDVAKLDEEIYDVMTEISRCVAAGDSDGAAARRSQLMSLINKRSVASGETHDFESRIAALQSERSALVSTFGALLETVYSTSSGWYYSKTDGYEEAFSSKKIDSLTYDGFKECVSSQPASTNRSAGKMVTDCRWYFVCEMTKEKLKDMNEGENHTLYFPYNSSQKLTMKLHSISLGENGMGIAVFTTDKIPTGFDFARVQSYELLESEYTGFRIPKSAVRIVDGQMGVYVLTGEIVNFRRIEVICEEETFFLAAMTHEEKKADETEETADSTAEGETDGEEKPVQKIYAWLDQNENIITSGKGLRDGRIITNVY